MAGASNLNFSTGTLVDPTRSLSNALATTSDVIGNISKQYLQQQQLDENKRRWDTENQRQADLFNMQMDESKRKKAAYDTTQNFAKTYDPQKIALGIVKEQYADTLASDLANKALVNMGPEMSFDENDKQNVFNAYKEASLKSFDTNPQRKALLNQLAGTVSQQQMEATARKQALAAGVPVENVDAVVKSLGQMGTDWASIDKLGREQKQQEFDNLVKIAKEGNEAYTTALKNSATSGKPIDPTVLFNTLDGDLNGRLTNWGTNSRKAAVDVYNNIMNMDTFTVNGKTYTPTYQQKAAIAGVVINSNRVGDGSKFRLSPVDGVAQAMRLVANGQVNNLGVVNKNDIDSLILDNARKQALTPYVSGQTQTVNAIKNALLSEPNKGINTVKGNNIPVGEVSPMANSVIDKNVLPAPTTASTPDVVPNNLPPITLEQYNKNNTPTLGFIDTLKHNINIANQNPTILGKLGGGERAVLQSLIDNPITRGITNYAGWLLDATRKGSNDLYSGLTGSTPSDFTYLSGSRAGLTAKVGPDKQIHLYDKTGREVLNPGNK